MAAIGLLSGCELPASSVLQRANVSRIGYLASGGSGPGERDEAFRQGLHELGYVEGKNIVIEWRFAERADRLRDLAAELVRLQVAVIVVAGGPAVTAAKDATRAIPTVLAVSGDPVAQGYVTSLARPGGNITGLTSLSSTPLGGKRLQLLKEIVPEASRIAGIWNPDSSAKALEFKEVQSAATPLGLTLQSLGVRGRDDFDRAFEAVATGHADAPYTFTDPVTFAHRTQIVDFALRSRLPSVSQGGEFVAAGGLIAYGPDTRDLYGRAASYVDKILKGAKPADLPIEQPSRFELVINLQTAQALGLTIPQSILQQATEVIQ